MSYESSIPQFAKDLAKKAENVNRISAESIAFRAKVNIAKATGRTARSITASPAHGEGEGSWEVTVDFPGHLLEFGTVKMSARPFLNHAADAEREAHTLAMKRALS